MSEQIRYYCEQGNPYCVHPNCNCNTIPPPKISYVTYNEQKLTEVVNRWRGTYVNDEQGMKELVDFLINNKENER